MKKLWELKGPWLHLALFVLGFLEDLAFVIYLMLATSGEWLYVMPFVYMWQSMHDIYYTLDLSTWRDPWIRRFEKTGSALGAGFTVKFFQSYI